MRLPITSSVDDRLLAGLRDELALLEATEALLSAERRRLHQQIDSGFASDSRCERERIVSDERLQVHERINALRKLLGVSEETVVPSAADWVSPGFSKLEQAHTPFGAIRPDGKRRSA
jgi:hypothetical protein